MQLRSSGPAPPPPPEQLQQLLQRRASKRRPRLDDDGHGGGTGSREEKETPRERVLNDPYMLNDILLMLDPWETLRDAAAVCKSWSLVASR